ncbi:LOW QUALITY PROTEIN: hypothetical protein Dda_1983 [Drechslerella dactyloides]|uniref:Proteasome subunit beta type-3 n=1 Tax=Drechslerella dactyloides TaxID=74499 RepID=A0AAD6J320_DREDA|nr:LOW QUALITY PROTEIN: hypothetical protein Dda_1983 [Drechslerella dactyloides]
MELGYPNEMIQTVELVLPALVAGMYTNRHSSATVTSPPHHQSNDAQFPSSIHLAIHIPTTNPILALHRPLPRPARSQSSPSRKQSPYTAPLDTTTDTITTAASHCLRSQTRSVEPPYVTPRYQTANSIAGQQALTLSNNFPKIFNYGDVWLGLTGLATDVQTMHSLFRYKVNLYRLREEREIEPETMANLVSSTLYERRFGPFFVSPVVAGINQRTGKPFICGFDSIGCIDFAKDFIVSGTASDQLFGVAEGLWEPDLEPEELFETISQTLLNSLDRDALAGCFKNKYNSGFN